MKHATVFFLLGCLVLVTVMVGGCAPAEEEAAVAAESAEPPPPPKPEPGEFVTIPAGEFIMGTDERPDNAKDKPTLNEPEHTVDLPAYQIGVYEVTNAEFAKFQIESDYAAEGNWRQFYNIQKGDHPVANVTWQDAQEYCKWAGGRLPTEQEWEKAARGTDGRPYPWGEEYSGGRGNTNDAGVGNTVEVGEMNDESPFGLRDTFGNVTEWTSDKLAPYPNSPSRRDPNYRKGYIVVRGASYAIKGTSFYVYIRGAYLPKSQYGIGFRCAKDVASAEGEQESS